MIKANKWLEKERKKRLNVVKNSSGIEGRFFCPICDCWNFYMIEKASGKIVCKKCLTFLSRKTLLLSCLLPEILGDNKIIEKEDYPSRIKIVRRGCFFVPVLTE